MRKRQKAKEELKMVDSSCLEKASQDMKRFQNMSSGVFHSNLNWFKVWKLNHGS